jgi:hypothetical protein
LIAAWAKPQAEAFLLESHHNDWSLAFATGELEAAQRHIEDG